MSLHVVHLVTSFDIGGLQNGLVNIVNGSDPDRVRHTILSMRDRIELAARLRQGEVISLGIPEGRQTGAYRLIAARLRELGADVLHTRNWGTYPDGILAARKAGVRYRVHGHHGRDLANAGGEKLRRRIIGSLLGLVTDRIVALTPSMKAEYRRDFRVAEGKIVVIPNGIDLGRMAAHQADPALRSPFTVATVGRLDPVKNLPLLIRAFARMPGRSAEDLLVIAGGGPEEDRVRAVAAEEGIGASLRLLGPRSDAPAVMKAADVYVQPSFYEGMSNTIVEAMACERAVIATDVGGNGDVAGREGTAILVPSDEVGALAAELGNLRADPARRAALARRGRERVVDLFGLERMIEAYTRLYEDLVPGRRPAGLAVEGARA
ncbi:MAG: glycosyltransferase [Planctomycetes bacterium]|nr:glycosyltransferase [Planctomycetota bacterium]